MDDVAVLPLDVKIELGVRIDHAPLGDGAFERDTRVQVIRRACSVMGRYLDRNRASTDEGPDGDHRVALHDYPLLSHDSGVRVAHAAIEVIDFVDRGTDLFHHAVPAFEVGHLFVPTDHFLLRYERKGLRL